MERDDRAIRNLVASYCDAIAERDDAAWADTWAEDAEWVLLGSNVRGRTAIFEHYKMLTEGVRWVVQQATDGIVEIDGDSARWRFKRRELTVAYFGPAHLDARPERVDP